MTQKITKFNDTWNAFYVSIYRISFFSFLFSSLPLNGKWWMWKRSRDRQLKDLDSKMWIHKSHLHSNQLNIKSDK